MKRKKEDHHPQNNEARELWLEIGETDVQETNNDDDEKTDEDEEKVEQDAA